MQQILITCREASVAAILLLPVYLLIKKFRLWNWRKCSAYYLFAVYLAAVYAAVGLPDITYYRYHPHFNFIPFLYMFSDMETTILNVILFFPLGLLLPVIWQDYRKAWRTFLLGFCMTFSIELLQIFTLRATDVNDLMTNFLGTILGFCCWSLLKITFFRNHISDSSNELAVVFISAFGIMFFIYPFIIHLVT